jgi:hypothetical protein
VNQNAKIAAVAMAAEELRKRDLIIFMLLLQLIQNRELSVRSPPGWSQAVRLPAREYRCKHLRRVGLYRRAVPSSSGPFGDDEAVRLTNYCDARISCDCGPLEVITAR